MMKLFCKYCFGHKRIKQEKGDIFYAEIRKNNMMLKADIWGIKTRIIPIKYCPMCRQKAR